AEEMALLLDVGKFLQSWRQNGSPGEQIHDLIRELKTLEEGARQANLPDMANLCLQLSRVHERAGGNQLTADEGFFVTMHRGHDALLDMVDVVAAGQNVVPPPAEVVEALNNLLAAETDFAEEPAFAEETDLATDEPEEAISFDFNESDAEE